MLIYIVVCEPDHESHDIEFVSPGYKAAMDFMASKDRTHWRWEHAQEEVMYEWDVLRQRSVRRWVWTHNRTYTQPPPQPGDWFIQEQVRDDRPEYLYMWRPVGV